jgi:DNA repair protein RecO (recombination protein O)
MEWRDQGIVLSVRRHGESNAIAELLTPVHGRAMGLVRGGRSRLQRPVLQPGNLVQVQWRARLEDHLGVFTLEPLALRAGFLMDDASRLSALSTLTALAQLLPEREPHPRVYEAAQVVLEAMENDALWPALLVRWELGLLDELGFGLDLTRCAATGTAVDLAYVSPKSGRAVSRAAGAEWHDRLFDLPGFLKGEGAATAAEVLAGFRLTGYFLARHVLEPRGVGMPPARERLMVLLGQKNR